LNAQNRAVVCAALAVLCGFAAVMLGGALGNVASMTLLFLSGLLAGVAAVVAFSARTSGGRDGELVSGEPSMSGALNWAEILGAMPDAAIVVDRSFVVLRYNAAAQHLFNLLQTGSPIEQVVHDPELFSAVARALEFAETREAHLASRGAAEQRLTAVVTPVRGGSKQRAPAAALITVRDESEQYRMLEMRTDFVANASHELRTPLASVRGFIETLQGPARNDEAARQRFLPLMAEQAERMTRLIDALLLLSRVEEKANLRPTGRVDVGEVIADAVRTMAPAAKARSMTISVAPGAEAFVVRGERDELFQVFQNIIENAVKYGRDGGSIRILTTRDAGNRVGRQVAIAIVDDGPGIAPDHLPRLTERFYRVNAEHSRRVGGTGLGLAIVKHIVNRHGGQLAIESVVGNGTTVRIVLPIDEKPPVSSA
jgi:two-component system phosphate regulon sensor histidine kinase PhoR